MESRTHDDGWSWKSNREGEKCKICDQAFHDGFSTCPSCGGALYENVPRQYSLVKDKYNDDLVYVYLGEIPNMPGHCVVVNNKTKEIKSGMHIENYVELTEDEV